MALTTCGVYFQRGVDFMANALRRERFAGKTSKETPLWHSVNGTILGTPSGGRKETLLWRSVNRTILAYRPPKPRR